MLLVLSLLLIFLGGTIFLMLVIYPEAVQSEFLQKTIFFGGLSIFGLGIILFIVACVKISLMVQANRVSKEALQTMHAQQVRSQNSVRYLPEQNTTSANRQTKQQKLAEMDKMEKTQFVVYVARLFAIKNYTVRFTSVIDNFGIDLLVTQNGNTIGVCCLPATEVVETEQLVFWEEAKTRYQLQEVMVVTNGFFHSSAVQFAKSHGILLTDRNLIAEDFLN